MARLRQPRYFIPLGLASVAAVAFVAAMIVFYAGYAIGRYEVGPFETAQRGEYKIFGRKFQLAGRDAVASSWGEQTKGLETIFFDLDVASTQLDLGEQGRGGAMTSFGDAVLLVTQEGDIFSVRGADDVRPANLTAPDNGLDAYKEAAAGPLKEYSHAFTYVRFNDILFYESEQGRGLALSYTDWDAENLCYRTAIATLPVAENTQTVEQLSAGADDWSIIFRTEPCLPPKDRYRMIEGHTAGGRLAFRSPGSLYLASGDYSWDGVYAPEALPQHDDNDYGKVIEIDLASGAARHVSIGHRNTQGILLDKNGRLWVAEHGERGGDELNLVRDGANYGWPVETLGTQYSKLPFPNTLSYGFHETHEAPVFAWLPSVAISSLTQVENFNDAWNGDILMGSLQSANLYRIRIRDERVLFTEVIPVGQRIRYVHQHNDGRIFLWTDDHYVVELTPAKADATQKYIDEYIASAPIEDALRAKLADAAASCMMCHSFRPDVHRAGPALGAVAGSAPGATSWDGYSTAIMNAGGEWTQDRLAAYINAPSDVIAGTSMPDPGVKDAAVQAELSKLLLALKEHNE